MEFSLLKTSSHAFSPVHVYLDSLKHPFKGDFNFKNVF